ncbi:Amidase [Ancylostoma ceylanicum]|uniref:Amidase n=1 Tax=Ancylostoma ceylanicum TaxID=53326 RepID=A0A0D6MBM6_9BILA|nr:Amidase [Ancylostoma ceylanicum]
MGCSSTLIYLVSRVYFLLITLIFYLLNYFKTKQVVSAPSDDLLMISATEAVKRIARREITSQALVRPYIHRIEKHIRSKPLLGVPFTVKDALQVEGQIVTCGIHNEKNNRCTQTAEVIKRMEAAGAILIAITNVPEACYWLESSNGIYGLTKNPYDSRRIVGGSSGGEGALISAAGSVIGIGSDIGGSIRIPSFMNGIFGLKPTPGVVPLDGYIKTPKGFQTQMVCFGPMCRYAEDMPLLMEVMAGDRAVDLHLKDSVDFKKIRIFYMEGIQAPTIQSLSCEMMSTLLKAVSYFEDEFNLEAIRLDLPLATKAIDMLFTSLQAEGAPKISESLLSLKGDKGSLNWKTELPKLLTGKSVHTPGALFMALFESMGKKSEEEKAEVWVITALQIRRLRDRLTRQVAETLGDDGILLFASWPTTAPFHHQPVFTFFDIAYTGLFNALALPVMQCPMGLDSRGLPLGVQVVGARNSDRLLIAAAQQLSQAFGGWIPPWSQ